MRKERAATDYDYPDFALRKRKKNEREIVSHRVYLRSWIVKRVN